jgi:hypothetical protein
MQKRADEVAQVVENHHHQQKKIFTGYFYNNKLLETIAKNI